MPEVKWNSTTIPEEGAIVYVLAADDRGNTRFRSLSSFETIAGGTLAREKSSILLSRDGGQLRMSNDDARCSRRSRLLRPAPEGGNAKFKKPLIRRRPSSADLIPTCRMRSELWWPIARHCGKLSGRRADGLRARCRGRNLVSGDRCGELAVEDAEAGALGDLIAEAMHQIFVHGLRIEGETASQELSAKPGRRVS